MKKLKKMMIVLLAIFGGLLIFSMKSYAGSVSINSTTKTVEPGSSFTVTVTGNNATGKVSISATNATVSQSSIWVENSSVAITVTAGGEGTATITAIASDVSDSTTAEEITGSDSVSVTVKKVEPAVTVITTPEKINTDSNTKTEYKQEAETESAWGLGAISVTGINENNEKVELLLDKEFSIVVYEYTIRVGKEIKRIEIYKDANEYSEYVQIIGLEEELKPGENIIILKLVKEGKPEVTYTIKVIKPELENEVKEKIEELENENIQDNKSTEISMPIYSFVLLESLVVILSSGVTLLINRKFLNRKK